MSDEMISFADLIPDIKSIEDLHYLDKKFFDIFKRKTGTGERFEKTASELFDLKTFRGCTDIGISIAPILRYKGIPTIYLDTANVKWIESFQKDIEKIKWIEGHVYLEIYLNNKWYLYDPTRGLVYDNYDYNNHNLPKDALAFARALDAHDLGVHDCRDERNLIYDLVKDYDVSGYVEPNYGCYDIRRGINLNKDIIII